MNKTPCEKTCDSAAITQKLTENAIGLLAQNVGLRRENGDLHQAIASELTSKVVAEQSAETQRLLMAAQLRCRKAHETALIGEVTRFASAYVSGEGLIQSLREELASKECAVSSLKARVELLEKQRGDVLAGYDNVVADLEKAQKKVERLEKKLKRAYDADRANALA